MIGLVKPNTILVRGRWRHEFSFQSKQIEIWDSCPNKWKMMIFLWKKLKVAIDLSKLICHFRPISNQTTPRLIAALINFIIKYIYSIKVHKHKYNLSDSMGV